MTQLNLFNRFFVFVCFILAVQSCNKNNHDNEMEFSFFVGGSISNPLPFVRAKGLITKSTPQKFLEFIKFDIPPCDDDWCPYSKEQYNTISFESEGGDLLAALELGRLIRKHRFHTILNYDSDFSSGLKNTDVYVNECISACAYAFMGGVSRRLGLGDSSIDGKIGVHQFYGASSVSANTPGFFSKILKADEEIEKAQYHSAHIIDYLDEMGVGSQIFSMAAKVPPNKVHYLDRKTLINNNVITYDIFDLKLISPFTIMHLATKSSAERKFGIQKASVACINGSYGEIFISLRVDLIASKFFGVSNQEYLEALNGIGDDYLGFTIESGVKKIWSLSGDLFPSREARKIMSSIDLIEYKQGDEWESEEYFVSLIFDTHLERWHTLITDEIDVLYIKPQGNWIQKFDYQPTISLHIGSNWRKFLAKDPPDKFDDCHQEGVIGSVGVSRYRENNSK